MQKKCPYQEGHFLYLKIQLNFNDQLKNKVS